MAEKLPAFASTKVEVRQAVEQNAIDRGGLFIDIIVGLNIEGILHEVNRLALDYDKEEWRETAQLNGISARALEQLDACDPPIPYVYYFSSPLFFLELPHLISYYRNVAMLSSKVMKGIGLDCSRYEDEGEATTFRQGN